MSNLVVIGFDDEATAFDMRAKLAKMQKEYLIKMDDVVVVTKNEKGNHNHFHFVFVDDTQWVLGYWY